MVAIRISYPLLGKGGVVAMVIHSLLLRGPPSHLEKKEEVIVAISRLPRLGKEGVVVMVIHLFFLAWHLVF